MKRLWVFALLLAAATSCSGGEDDTSATSPPAAHITFPKPDELEPWVNANRQELGGQLEAMGNAITDIADSDFDPAVCRSLTAVNTNLGESPLNSPTAPYLWGSMVDLFDGMVRSCADGERSTAEAFGASLELTFDDFVEEAGL